MAAVVLAKCPAARAASLASCDCEGDDGAVEVSDHVPAKIPDGFPAAVPAPLQKVVPYETPWQYWVTEFSQSLPPTPFRKFWRIVASPEGSLLHCEPHSTRYTFGAVSTPIPPTPPR